jgi:bacterioferritin-associated ferredoxin
VGTLTGAGTGCGRCKPIIAQCIEGHLSNTPVLQLTIPFGHNGK